MRYLIIFLLFVYSLKTFSQNSVGIGTSTPQSTAVLHVDAGTSQTRGFIVTGSSTGAHYYPNLGPGKRMMYYPGHAAFRAGLVSGTHWDEVNAGYYSAAFGNDVIASGTGSFAAGFKSTAAGNFSNALGLYSISKGICLTVVGMYNDSLLAADPGVASPTSPLFVVGNGDAGAISNALLVRKDGNVAIGNFTPEYKLDVAGRMRLRSGGDALTSPGIWFNQVDNLGLSAFLGMINDIHVGLYGNLGAGWQFSMNTTNGNVGIGTAYPGINNKLDVYGNLNLTGALRINDHPGFAGQVLSSNANASPTWVNMPVSNPQVGFFAKKNNNQSIPNNVETVITSFTESFDDGNGFNPNTGVFTAPSAGMYHFDTEYAFNVNPNFEMIVNCRFYINNVGSEATAVQINSNFNTSFSYNVKLAAGDAVTIKVFQNNGTAISLLGFNSFFSGFRVY